MRSALFIVYVFTAFFLAQSESVAGVGVIKDAAAARAEQSVSTSPYEDLIQEGLNAARAGDSRSAEATFTRATAREPRRAQAWLLLGELHFLEKRYDDAARRFSRAYALDPQGETCDLLASSFYLAGHTNRALPYWNALKRPVIQGIKVQGLTRMHDHRLRTILSIRPGRVLTADDLRQSAEQLEEMKLFDRVQLRTTVLPAGANVEVTLIERHGFASSPMDFASSLLGQVISERIGLRYRNIKGAGVSFGGHYRWQENRPEVQTTLDWAMPCEWPITLQLQGVRGRQRYQLDGRDSELRSKGLGLRLRHVLGPGSVGEVALRYRDRRFTQALEDNHNNTGSLWSLEASSAKVVAQTERLILRFEPQARAGHVAGADSYFRASARLGTRLILVAPGKEDVEPGSSIQGQAVVAWGSRHLPIDEVYAPGFGPDMDYPLRGHAQLKKGVQGIAPLSERIGLVNLEWRHWVIKKPRYRVGGVLGTDYAYLQKLRNLSSRAHLLDIGVGLRLFLQANTLIRIDYGRGLFDQSQALSTGMGHSF